MTEAKRQTVIDPAVRDIMARQEDKVGGSKSCVRGPTAMAGPWRRYASKAAMSAIFSSMKGWREPGPGGVSPGADRRIVPPRCGTIHRRDGRVRVRAGWP